MIVLIFQNLIDFLHNGFSLISNVFSRLGCSLGGPGLFPRVLDLSLEVPRLFLVTHPILSSSIYKQWQPFLLKIYICSKWSLKGISNKWPTQTSKFIHSAARTGATWRLECDGKQYWFANRISNQLRHRNSSEDSFYGFKDSKQSTSRKYQNTLWGRTPTRIAIPCILYIPQQGMNISTPSQGQELTTKCTHWAEIATHRNEPRDKARGRAQLSPRMGGRSR